MPRCDGLLTRHPPAGGTRQPALLLLLLLHAKGGASWRCSGCPAAPACFGTCPACDPVCVHGSCVHDQCYCSHAFSYPAGQNHACTACAPGARGLYPNCTGGPPAPSPSPSPSPPHPGPPHPSPHPSPPNTKWAPNYESTGVYTTPEWHAAESTPFRFKGKMFVMESVEGHPTDTPWPVAEGGSYFRVSDLATGAVISYVKESIGHAFFSAVVDDVAGRVWVFGAAHHRGWDNAGPCDRGSAAGQVKGCYVGVWSSTDLISWSKTAKTVTFPDGNFTQNNDVTLVRPQYRLTHPEWRAFHGALPRHQAAMALEAEGGSFSIAVNTANDGDLSRQEDWIILWDVPRAPEHACPAIRFDPQVHLWQYVSATGILLLSKVAKSKFD